MDSATFSVPSVHLGAGTYYLLLRNATASPSGYMVFWDVNNGPSQVWESSLGFLNSTSCAAEFSGGTTCSDAFEILGTTGSGTPEPAGLALAGSGLLLLCGLLRLRRA